MMGGLKNMVTGSFRKRGSSGVSADEGVKPPAPPPGELKPPASLKEEDVPKCRETTRLEAALVEVKKSKDRVKMKSVKAQLAVSKENDMQAYFNAFEKARLVKEIPNLQKKLDEAWEADDEELIDKFDEIILRAKTDLKGIEKKADEEVRFYGRGEEGCGSVGWGFMHVFLTTNLRIRYNLLSRSLRRRRRRSWRSLGSERMLI